MQISVTQHIVATLMIAGMCAVGCQQSQGPSPWNFEDSGPEPDAESDAADIRADLPEDTWRGWYKASQSAAPSVFYPDGVLQKNPHESGTSFGCRPSVQPQEPAWGVNPMPSTSDLRRYRLPADAPGAEPTLSSDRLAYADVTGELTDSSDGTGNPAAIDNATVSTEPCDTLDRMGRCGVPDQGDICSKGIETYSQSEHRISVSKAGIQGGWGPLEFDIQVDFNANVADGGTTFRIETSNNPFGPDDGRLHDFQLDDNTLVSLKRMCGSIAGNIVISYPPEETEGWFRTIPAADRSSDKNLVLFNLTATEGTVEDSAGYDDPESICSASRFELWFAAEYEPTPG